jgi:hypothetical protein
MMPSGATAVYIEGPLLEGTFYQHKKTKMAKQQNSTVTTQQEHTAKPHTKP